MTVRFSCPRCHHGLHLKANYFRVLYFISIVTLAGLAYAIGFRRDSLLGIVVLGLWPTYLVVVFITVRLFPPDVETSGDFRDILYPPEGSEEPREEERTIGALVLGRRAIVLTTLSDRGDEAATAESRSEPDAPLSCAREPRTIEGVVLFASALVLLVAMVWLAAGPLIHRLFPEFQATRKGPQGFPVTLHIGQNRIGFTNGSHVRWMCEARLGYIRDSYSCIFELGPGETRQIPYVGFTSPAGNVEPEDARSAAWERGDIECAEPSGRTHSWGW